MNHEALGNVDFVAISHRFTLTGVIVLVKVQSLSQIDLFENHLY